LPETHDWPLADKLRHERETLGFYLSGHPMDPYRDDLVGVTGFHLGQLEKIWSERAEDEKRGWRPEKTVVLAGQVTGMRRKGESQAFVQLEDGRGRIECAFFAETFTEYAALLTRDRILIIEGGLREDEFSGGFSLRARRCWDYSQVCTTQALRLALRLDLRVPGAMEAVDAVLDRHRPGPTPIRFELLREGAVGQLDLNGSRGIRIDQELAATLRAQPGVRTVKLALGKPWAQ
jgi:DNA polymerase III, alpha subunit (EC 2.7.7.7)